MIPNRVREWLLQQGNGEVMRQQAVAGGCINNGARLETASGASFFLKTNSSAPEDMFSREAEGLAELRQAAGPRFPEAYLWAEEFLLLEDLAPAPRAPDYWETLGRQLAQLHGHTKSKFGFEHDNYLGTTPQPNVWMDDGFAFFAEQRLDFQAKLARDNERLTRSESGQVERLAARLPELVPQQPAALIHGDLWDGNAISDSRGAPALIDPAAHYGWPEAELGMSVLFDGFEPPFYAAYENERPLDKGWRQCLPIYNLYHLLNHLNLFGEGYHSQVMETVRQFA